MIEKAVEIKSISVLFWELLEKSYKMFKEEFLLRICFAPLPTNAFHFPIRQNNYQNCLPQTYQQKPSYGSEPI